MTQSETFEWLRERSNRLEIAEAERDQLKTRVAELERAATANPIEREAAERAVAEIEKHWALFDRWSGSTEIVACECGWGISDKRSIILPRPIEPTKFRKWHTHLMDAIRAAAPKSEDAK